MDCCRYCGKETNYLDITGYCDDCAYQCELENLKERDAADE